LITNERAYRANALKIDLKSTVGAGDALLAGCLYGLMNHLPLPDLLRFASVCGSLACSGDRGKIITKNDVLERLDEIVLKTIEFDG
jgi:1-phosphofructokinase